MTALLNTNKHDRLTIRCPGAENNDDEIESFRNNELEALQMPTVYHTMNAEKGESCQITNKRPVLNCVNGKQQIYMTSIKIDRFGGISYQPGEDHYFFGKLKI